MCPWRPPTKIVGRDEAGRLAGGGEAAEAQGRVFQPVPSSSLAQPEPEASTAVYNRTGGWLEPAASPFLYLLGHQVRCQLSAS